VADACPNQDVAGSIPVEHADLVYLMASTGLRNSEALNLR
jgi:hypothetical protein